MAGQTFEIAWNRRQRPRRSAVDSLQQIVQVIVGRLGVSRQGLAEAQRRRQRALQTVQVMKHLFISYS